MVRTKNHLSHEPIGNVYSLNYKLFNLFKPEKVEKYIAKLLPDILVVSYPFCSLLKFLLTLTTYVHFFSGTFVPRDLRGLEAFE